MSKVRDFLADRVGWQKYIKPFLEKPLPPKTGWTATLGSVAALLFGIQVVTGIFLAFYYSPSPDHAYQSVQYIMHEVHLGDILRNMHHWGASLMLVVVVLHLIVNFFEGTFKPPRELTWIAGVVLLLLTLAFGFTGYLLPWDLKAYWATIVGVEMIQEVPLLGGFLGKLIMGGEWVSGLTLTRFYALHVLVLPALTALFVVFHVYLVRLHDVAGPPVKHAQEETKSNNNRFFPEHLFRCTVVFGFFFAVLLLFTFLVEVPLEEEAGVPDPDYVPRPEWFFMGLYELLFYFPGRFEVIGSFILPSLAFLILFLLPFLSRTRFRALSDRPFGLAAGVTAVVAVVYLTVMGIGKSQPYGDEMVLPDRPLTQNELKGLDLYMELDCAYCHTVLGEAGRREGPDLSNVEAKDRSKEWLIDFIKDPQAISRWAVMPQYSLTDEELDALAEFMLAFDFSEHEPKTFSKQELEEKRERLSEDELNKQREKLKEGPE